MKKLLVALLALAMVFALASCDDTNEPSEAVYLSTGTMSDVKFENTKGASLTTEDGENFKVVGDLTPMSADQATAFGWAEKSLFLSLKVKGISEDNPVKEQGWVSTADSTDYVDKKSDSTKTGKILAITNGESVRSDITNQYIWKVVLTDGKTYTVDFSDQFKALTTPVEG